MCNLARRIEELALLSTLSVCDVGWGTLGLLGQARAEDCMAWHGRWNISAMRLRAASSRGAWCYARHYAVPVICQLVVCGSTADKGKGRGMRAAAWTGVYADLAEGGVVAVSILQKRLL